jgi:hypothetical protein
MATWKSALSNKTRHEEVYSHNKDSWAGCLKKSLTRSV